MSPDNGASEQFLVTSARAFLILFPHFQIKGLANHASLVTFTTNSTGGSDIPYKAALLASEQHSCYAELQGKGHMKCGKERMECQKRASVLFLS
jgi:hypothetical protein